MSKTFACCSLLLVAACASPPPPSDPTDGGQWAEDEDEGESERQFKFQVQPYLFLANVSGDAGVGQAGPVPVTVDLGEVLQNFELGGMLHAEAHHRSGWGVILDYGLVDLGSDRGGGGGQVLDADVRQSVLEAFVNYRSEMRHDSYFDMYAGVRWWDVNLDLSLSPGPTGLSRGVDWVDPVIGVRFTVPFGKSWHLLTRADAGGFGVSSDFSWTLAGGLRYHLSETFALEAQYKAMSVDYQEGQENEPGFFEYDTITHGPFFGFSIDF